MLVYQMELDLAQQSQSSTEARRHFNLAIDMAILLGRRDLAHAALDAMYKAVAK